MATGGVGNAQNQAAIERLQLFCQQNTVSRAEVASDPTLVSIFDQCDNNPKDGVISGGELSGWRATLVGMITNLTNVGNTNKANNTASPGIIKAKEACQADIDEFKALGIEVSDWDKNNCCTLSFGGYECEVSIDESGQMKLGENFTILYGLATGKFTADEVSTAYEKLQAGDLSAVGELLNKPDPESSSVTEAQLNQLAQDTNIPLETLQKMPKNEIEMLIIEQTNPEIVKTITVNGQPVKAYYDPESDIYFDKDWNEIKPDVGTTS